jgi:mannose-6-phosphate isomerase-like protein (cupin superfamily)
LKRGKTLVKIPVGDRDYQSQHAEWSKVASQARLPTSTSSKKVIRMPFRLRHFQLSTAVPTAIALALSIGWAFREAAHARERAALVSAQTINLDEIKMSLAKYEDKPVGQIGFYIQGDTPASSNFVTGRFIIDPGKSPHRPHVHSEEEVMIVETGHGEIFCDGKTTKVGPGSVMFTTPNAPHGINNTGSEPLTFYFVKWGRK